MDNPAPIEEEAKEKVYFQITNTRWVYIGGLVVVILILVAVTSLLFFSPFNKNSGNVSPTGAPVQKTTQQVGYRAHYGEVFSSASAVFRQSIKELPISDALIEALKKDPSMLVVQTRISAPNYGSMDNTQVKTAFRNYLLEQLDDVDKQATKFITTEYMDLSPALGRLLNIVVYEAKIRQTPYLNTSDKAIWAKSINDGKVTVSDMLSLMGTYKAKGQKWINENVYNKPEFNF